MRSPTMFSTHGINRGKILVCILTVVVCNICLLSFQFIGCSLPTPGANSDTTPGETDVTYKVSSTLDVTTQYGSYLLNVSPFTEDNRYIYVAGRRTSTIGADRVWWSYGNQKGTAYYWDLGGTNGYFDIDNSTSARSYTVRIPLDPIGLNAGTNYSFQINIGDGTIPSASSNFTVKAIAARQFDIKYSYQMGKDVLNDANLSQDCINKNNKAFGDALTKVTFSNEAAGLASVTVPDLDPAVPGPDEGLWKYVYESICGGNENQLTSTRFRLIGVANISSELSSSTVGYTMKTPNGTNTDMWYGWSFVIYDRTSIISPSLTRKKEVTRIVIHELGHLWGQFHDITNSAHSSGHNGVNQKKCVMLDGDDPNVSAIRDNPVFCEGHIQFLLNEK